MAMSTNGTRRRMKESENIPVGFEEDSSPLPQHKGNTNECTTKEPMSSNEKENGTDRPIDQIQTENENAGVWGKLQPKWRNWWIRGFVSLVMFGGFAVVVYFGPVALILLIQCIQIKCYHEIISIGHKKYQKHNLPWFRSLSWYFLGCSNYFFYGESISEFFNGVPQKEEVVKTFLTYHRFISFLLYCIGLVLFVLSLKKDYYKVQFSLFGWTHVTLLIVVTQSHLIMQTLFEGLIWFFLPVSMVICNDIMAYIFGFFFGRTPLIKLSPKKTWEGFIGGGVSTVIYGWLISYVMCQYQYFVCPVEFVSVTHDFRQECEPSATYQLTSYSLPPIVQYILSLGGWTTSQVWIYPMQLHSLALALFSSLIAPFGGFLASGFKRAFKVKDFGDLIPGHGGIMDRFDCQYLMATFVHVYFFTFIRAPQPQKIYQMILALKPENQVKIFEKLRTSLTDRGLI